MTNKGLEGRRACAARFQVTKGEKVKKFPE